MNWSRLTGKPKLANDQRYFDSWKTNIDDDRKPQGQISYEKRFFIDDPLFPENASKKIIITKPY
jgi:hypothetical protein